MTQYIFDRLNEPSTWRGLVGVATAFGVYLSPAQAEAIIAAGLAVVGLINVFRKEKKLSAET